MTRALASSRQMVVGRKSSYTSVPFLADSGDRKETNSLPTDSTSMARVAPKRELSRLSVSVPHRLLPRAGAILLPCSPFVFYALSLSWSFPVGFLLRSLGSTLLRVLSPSSPTSSTSQPPNGINGAPKKARCTCLPWSVVGPVPWLHSVFFGTSRQRLPFRSPFGSLSRSTVERSAGCYLLLARKRFILYSVPRESQQALRAGPSSFTLTHPIMTTALQHWRFFSAGGFDQVHK
jgi:hypothetical protein